MAAGPGIPAPYPQGGCTPKNITTNASTQVKAAPGILFGLSVNTPGTTSTVTLFDGLSAAGTKIGTYSTTALGGPVISPVGIAFLVGLFAVTAGGAAADITVQYF